MTMTRVSANVSKLPIGGGDYREKPNDQESFAARVINQIFDELQSIFPAWRNALPNDKAVALAKRNYVKAMISGGVVSMAQVRTGLDRARQEETDFFPSCGKFVAWCDTEDWRPAYERLIARKPAQSDVEKLVRQDVAYAIRHDLSEAQAEKRFAERFRYWKQRERSGDMPSAQFALPARSSVHKNDIRNGQANQPAPENFCRGSVFARIAQLGKKGSRYE